jgi:hypothetical protein
LRNNNAYKDKETRYQRLMNEVIKKGVKTKVLMLSATPVNNRFTDLKNQLALAYEGKSETLNEKLNTKKDIDTIFRNAQAVFNTWSKLDSEKRTASAILNALDFDFFELLDSVTIARSRKRIQTFYDTSAVGTFPNRLKPISHHPKLTNRTDVIGFNEIFKNLSLLKLSVYAPITYILPSRVQKYEDMYDTNVKDGRGTLRQVDREKSLQKLMTTNLLKRLESSVNSFRITLEKLRSNHVDTLSKIDNFESNGMSFDTTNISSNLENIELDDEDISNLEDNIIGNKVKIELSDMDLSSWKYDLEADLLLINSVLDEMYKIAPKDDFKLQHIQSLIDDKVKNPINIVDGQSNKKVIIFTAFADTADYLYEHLSHYFLNVHNLHTSKITGSKTPISTLDKSYDFQSLLTLFSPLSKDKELVLSEEKNEIDILIGTDCISEGQNLQDCDYLINYDIHWNPVRIIQRFGRVDRIGSKNSQIQLVNYWPDITLDEYINLKDRVENRMIIADVTATGDDNVLSAKANDISYRQEQLKKLFDDEVIEMEDLKTGISITDLGLNDFRMDLLNFNEIYGEQKNIPTGLHSVVPSNKEMGLESGVIFTLYNRHKSVNIEQQNRLHPYYLIYISNSGEILANHLEVKRLLDITRNASLGQNKPIEEAYKAFNEITQDGKDMEYYSDLLDTAISSMIAVQEDKDIDSLFSGGNTTALTNKINGLDDFELISFLVVQDID